jgi:hypothetical protein
LIKKPTKTVLKKKNFLVKNFKFWPIVEDATGLKLFLTLSSATLDQNSVEFKTQKALKIVGLL